MSYIVSYIQKVMSVDPVAGAELITLNNKHIMKELRPENEKNKKTNQKK